MQGERQPETTRPTPVRTPTRAGAPVGVTRPDARRAIVVGRVADVPRALEHPAVCSDGTLDVVAIASVSGEDDEAPDDARAVERLLVEHHVEAILVAGPVGRAVMGRVSDLALAHQCRLLAVMPTEVLAGHLPEIVWEGESPLVQLSRLPRQRWQTHAKRALDVAGAAIGLAVAGPVMLVLAALVRLESPGSPFFAHERVGRAGRRFFCWKLRTMQLDAEEVLRSDPALMDAYRRNHYKLPDDADPRVTRLGHILRRASLDELPQLWNVLVGEMSLVGPRPVVPEELEHFVGSEALLLSVRPGLTGGWAVNGRHHVGYPQRADLELRYVRHWSIRGDVGILARTFGAVLDPSGDEAA